MKPKVKIAVESSVPYVRGLIEHVAEAVYLDSADFDAARIQGAEALIIRSITRCTPELLKGSNVKLITTATAGFDHIDLAYCEAHGIEWRNAPGCNATAVAQYVVGSLSSFVLRGEADLKHLTLGIVGLGHVGREVKRLAEALGMTVIANDPPRADKEGTASFVSLSEIAERSDIITFHVPLIANAPYPTYHLIDDSFLDSLKRRPILINACRGAVASTEALIRAKQKGLISRLVVDCWEEEPLISEALLAVTDIATPHIAGFSADGKCNGSKACLENIRDFFHLPIPGIEEMAPPPPSSPLISLSRYMPEDRLWQALAATFDPLPTDMALRQNPKHFEALRKTYIYPREMRGYRVDAAGLSPSEINNLQKLDFRI